MNYIISANLLSEMNQIRFQKGIIDLLSENSLICEHLCLPISLDNGNSIVYHDYVYIYNCNYSIVRNLDGSF